MTKKFSPKSAMINGHIQPLAPIENLGLPNDTISFLNSIGGIKNGYRLEKMVFILKKIGSADDDGVLLYFLNKGYLDLVSNAAIKNYRDD